MSIAGIDHAASRPGAIRAAVLVSLPHLLALIPEWQPADFVRAGPLELGLLDRLDGWQRVYADAFAVGHIRMGRPQ